MAAARGLNSARTCAAFFVRYYHDTLPFGSAAVEEGEAEALPLRASASWKAACSLTKKRCLSSETIPS